MPAVNPYFPPPPAPLEFLHIDEYLLAINKPSGLLTVPGRGPGKQDCLLLRLQHTHPEALVVHRLDMETSGIVLFARDIDTQRRLGKQFAGREIDKTYVAIVKGRPKPPQGEIDLPLMADWPNRPKQKVDHERGKPSRTCYRVLDSDEVSSTSRVELKPVTGRSHQLRVHMMSLGHPIVGDRLYGQETSTENSERLMLHASELAFTHPRTGAAIQLESAAPFFRQVR